MPERRAWCSAPSGRALLPTSVIITATPDPASTSGGAGPLGEAFCALSAGISPAVLR